MGRRRFTGGFEEPIESGAKGTRRLETEVISESEDEIREERVEKNEEDERPLEENVDEDESDSVCFAVDQRRESVGRHGRI